MDLPQFLQIEPVGQCNLRCRMCPVQFRKDGTPGTPPAFMPFHVFCQLIGQFPRLAELHLQGLGEPLLHLHFFDMVRYAVARGIRVSTNTNMTVLTESMARNCVASGLHSIFVSIDGASAESYEAIRVGAHFPRVMRNLRRLVQAKGEAGSTTPEITVVMVIMRRNLGELPGLVQLAHDQGIDRVSVQHLCHDFSESSLPAHYQSMRDFIDDQTLLHEDGERIAHYFGQARDVAQRLGMALRLPRIEPHRYPPDTPGRKRCDWPWRGSYISYDGQAMPCCMVATPDRISFGNMVSEGAETVWNNTAYNTFRDQLGSTAPPEICRSCALYHGTF